MKITDLSTPVFGGSKGGGAVKQITLLSITTAPTGEFAKGSQYYDATTKKVYTATDDNTWNNADESNPQFGTIYVYNNNYYQWDGDNLVETDLEKYQLVSNISQNFEEDSETKYPSSKALSDGLNSLKNTFPTIVTDSGSSLPSASGFELNDTFLNTSDKKIYKTLADTHEWNTDVTHGAVTIDYTTGIVTNISQGYQNPRILHRQIGNTLWNGNKTYQVTFKMNSFSQTGVGGNGLITFNASKNTGTTYNRSFGVTKDKKFFYTEGYKSLSSYYKQKEEIFFDISENKKYTLVIEKTSSSCNVSLLENGTQVATTSFTINDFSSVATSAYIEYGIAYITDQYGRGLYTNGDIYLLESSGEFLKANSELSWDSGTDLTDKTEYADKTNSALYLYDNSELVKIGGNLTKKVYTIRADNTSTLDVSSDFTKIVDVLKNGVELALTDDYTISNGVITFVTALSTTDKITVKGE